MALAQEHRFVSVETPLGKDVLLLRDFSYSEALGSLFVMELDVVREKADVKFSDIIGQNVTVRVRIGANKARFFSGYVSRFSCVGHEEGFARYNATVVPWLWFLTQTSDCRIFQNKTVPQIIEEVFGDPEYKGIVDVEWDGLTRSDYRKWEYCVQYRETDFNFVSRLMEQEGICYYWKHRDRSHTMVIADDPSVHDPYPGYEVIPYYPPTEELREKEHVFQWDVEQEVRTRVYTHTDFNFKTPRTPLGASRKWDPPYVSPELEIFDYPGEYTTAGEGGAYARTRIEEIERGFETLRGETTARGISAGFTFELTNHPSQEQQREYLVTRVSLSGANSGFYSGQTEGEDFNCSFTAIDASKPYRHPRTTPKPSIPGPQTAIVTGREGQEICPDEYGRVKVQFPWDRYGKSDENSSCWIRVAQVWAGKGWGAMAIPRVGQEVIVEFLEGDPDQPMITGRVYNAQCMPPYTLPDNKTQTGIKSRSSKGGSAENFNEIRFEDKKGSEEVYIHGEKDMNTVVESNETLSVGGNRFKMVGGDETMGVRGERIDAVKGEEHCTVGADRKETVLGNRHLLVESEHFETVKSSRHTHIGGAHFEKVDGMACCIIGSNSEQTVDGSMIVSAISDIHLKAGANVVIEAGSQLTLKVGGNFISIGNSSVDILGALVNINSGGAPGSVQEANPEEPTDAEPAKVPGEDAGQAD